MHRIPDGAMTDAARIAANEIVQSPISAFPPIRDRCSISRMVMYETLLLWIGEDQADILGLLTGSLLVLAVVFLIYEGAQRK